jgi:aminomethyltransferase
MGVPTPFYSKIAPLCKSMRYKEWAGYFCPEKYDTVHDNEYHVFRQAAGVLDISPLYKYDVSGRDAERLLNRIMARDVTKLKVGQVAYVTWCEEDGKVIDDGTLARLEETYYRITSANPSLSWFVRHARKLDVKIVDRSQDIAALALQGPRSRAVLEELGVPGIGQLKFFHATRGKVAGLDLTVTRTGYTGDLGYELWVEAAQAEPLWDAVFAAGQKHNIAPVGLLALDMTRVEAGFILIDVDYTSSRHALIDAQKSSPYEIGLGWTVHLDKAPFIGQEALAREKQRGSDWAFVGLEIGWDELEALYDAIGLPPHVPTQAWRSVIPLYEPKSGRQIGRATSGTWSPLLKKNLALATVQAEYAELDTRLHIETMIEYDRKMLPAVVSKKPFFDPPRKKSTIKAQPAASAPRLEPSATA